MIDDAKIGGNHARRINFERNMRTLPTVHPTPDDSLRVLNRDFASPAFQKHDGRNHTEHD